MAAPGRKWTREEEAFLRAAWGHRSSRALKKRLRRSSGAIYSHARKLGLGAQGYGGDSLTRVAKQCGVIRASLVQILRSAGVGTRYLTPLSKAPRRAVVERKRRWHKPATVDPVVAEFVVGQLMLRCSTLHGYLRRHEMHRWHMVRFLREHGAFRKSGPGEGRPTYPEPVLDAARRGEADEWVKLWAQAQQFAAESNIKPWLPTILAADMVQGRAWPDVVAGDELKKARDLAHRLAGSTGAP